MHFKLKTLQLNDFYDYLLELSKSERDDETVEIGILQQGIGLKLNGKTESITLYFYPDHKTSEISVMRNGMRYIYPKRVLRMKKHTLCDLIDFFKKDERLQGCLPMMEWHLNQMVKYECCNALSKKELC